MSFVRPEAAETWNRWKQVILGLAIAGFGLSVVISWFGIAKLGGVAIIAMGGLVAIDGWRRARFPAGSGGAGVVYVTEREIRYMSGSGGGSVSLEDLTRIEIHRNLRGRVTWVFYQDDHMLEFPGDAEGTAKLFDAFSALNGVNYSQAEAAANGQGPDLFLVWQKDKRKLH